MVTTCGCILVRAGAKAKAAAQACAQEIAPQAKPGKFWERSLGRSVICGASSRRMSLQVPTFAPRAHEDSAEKTAALAGLSAPVDDLGNIQDTSGSVEPEHSALSHCLAGSPGRIRTARPTD
jgi:hypothetical protein